RRLVELLKQANGSPMPVEEQVVSLFAGTAGFLDDLDVADVRRFESGLIEDVRSRHSDLLKEIRDGGALPEDKLKEAIAAYKDRFTSSRDATAALPVSAEA
ncbi:MAG: F-type H+/Na+-transporting ATPase subunit alpha, partial [Actinomycetota bacterium]|nr:F-type H+/Na+-transporting ATPase subunit alpha [Actinomycetota bacterium]